MANRYSNYTPSAYNPLSLEEIAMVPAMRRKQHDALTAQMEGIRSGLAKVDPYSKHFNEALALKQGIEGKMDQTASQLAQSGVNNDMIGKTIALNREYQDLVSPTGKIGQINAEKANIAKINDEYDKLAAQNKWSPAESDYWKSKALEEYNAKPIYDTTGKLINYTGPTSAPMRVDYAKKLDEYASNAKMSTQEFAKAAQQISQDESTGQKAVLGSSYSKKFGTNGPQVLAAYETMKREMSDPTSDVYKSIQYERRNPKDLLNTIARQSDIYKQTVSSSEQGNTINPFGKDPDDNGSRSDIPGIYGEDYNTQEVGATEQDFNDIAKVGQNLANTGSVGSPLLMGSGKEGGPKQKSGKFTHNDIDNPMLKARYVSTFKKLFKEGKINTTIDNPNSAKIVLNEIKKQGPITMTTKLLTNDIELDNSGFSESIGKTADDRDKQIRKQLRLTNAGARKLLDPETGKPISFQEAKEKYKLKGVDTATYHGYISPLNWEKDSFNGTNSKASPHVITVENEEGDFIEFKTSRLNSDNAGININRYNDLNKNYRNWSINRDEFIPFESKSNSLSKLKVKYNTKNPQVNPQRGVLDMEIMDENGNIHYMTQSEFVNSVNATR